MIIFTSSKINPVYSSGRQVKLISLLAVLLTVDSNTLTYYFLNADSCLIDEKCFKSMVYVTSPSDKKKKKKHKSIYIRLIQFLYVYHCNTEK